MNLYRGLLPSRVASVAPVAAVAAAVARVLGTYGAFAAALLYARSHIPELLALAQRVSPMPAMRMDIIAWRTEPLTQFRTYCLVLGVVSVTVLVHAVVLRLLRRWPLAVIAVEAAVLGSAWWMAFHASSFLDQVFLGAAVPASALLAPFVLPVRRPPGRVADARRDQALAIAIALQAFPLAWGVWMTTFDLPRTGDVIGAQLAAWGFSFWRSTRRSRPEEEALAGLAFVLLPVVGLLRSPHWGWALGAGALYGLILLAFRRRASLGAWARRSRARVVDLVVVATSWSFCAIFVTPYRFRDLPTLNHNAHEAGQYASINSIVHGKLMMADSGLIYGPLRSYALALYMAFAGMTAEQVRVGQALLTLGSLGLMVWLGWRLTDRRGVAMAWYLYLLLVGTYALDWVNYRGVIAFGWADLGRIGIPVFAAVGGTEAFLSCLRQGGVDRRAAWKLGGWGVAATVAVLWAQEFGACTVVALFSVPVVHAALLRGPTRARARIVGLTLAALAAGMLAAMALYLGVYALHGRAGLFLRTVTAQSAAFTSGSYGAMQFPVVATTFLSESTLLANVQHDGTAIEYALPAAVYFFTLVALTARAISRRWTERDALTLALLAFGATSFRFALSRSDYLHVATASLPAVLLVVRLAVEASDAVYASRVATRTLRVVAIGAAAYLAFSSLRLTGIKLALKPRLTAMLDGTERPSSGPPYRYPGIPRAGDVFIKPEYVALVEGILANSSPTDKIFQHISYMDGGEVYFLADRSNPTSYDVLAEFLTADRQHTGFEEVEKDPPKLTFGEDWGMTGPELNQYLKDNYHSIGDYGGWKLLMRNP